MAQYSKGTKIAQEKMGVAALANPTGNLLFVYDSATSGYDGADPRHSFTTLTLAVAAAQAGDTIILQPGGSETVTAAISLALAELKVICPVDNLKNGFTITGAGTLDLLSVTATDVHIEGLKLVHTGATANASGIKASAAAHRLTVKNCLVDDKDIVTTKTGVGVEVTCGADDTTVDGCLFLDAKYGVQFVPASTAESDRPVIKNSTFFIGLSGGFGVFAAQATGKLQAPQLVGNTFMEADGDGSAAANAWDGTDGTNGTQGPISFGAAVDQYLVLNNAAHTDSAVSFDLLNAINGGAAGSMVSNKSGSGGDVEDKIDVIDGYHDVPTADAVTNTVMRDAVGNKTDAAVGTVGTTKTVMAYAKGILTDTGTTIPATIVTLDALHDVPVADVATNAQMRDVAGNKTDAGVQAVAADKSVVAYVKGLLDILAGTVGITAFPAAAAAANDISLAEVIRHIQEDLLGAQAQAGVQTVGTGTPSMGYIKAILDTLSGSTGMTAWPVASAPGNGVSLAEGVRYISENQSWRTLEKTAISFAGTSDNLFTVTGEIECYVYMNTTTAIARAGGAVTGEIGTSDDTDLLMATVTDIRGAEGDVFGGTDAAANINTRGSICAVSGGGATTTILVTTSIAADSGAASAFLIWRPISTDGAVVTA